MDSILGIHGAALLVRSQRQEVLANNLANTDTPNFKARDLDWRKQLAALQGDTFQGSNKPDMVKTNSRHLDGFAVATANDFLKFRMPTQPSLDGNTVETHIEKAQFMENAIQYQATLRFLDSRISGIRTAWKGQ